MSIQQALKQVAPDYFESLAEKCKTCKYLLSSYQCDCCKEFDMYKYNKDLDTDKNETIQNNKEKRGS